MIAYIALFSALLSRLTALACVSAWVTSFIARFFFFFNIHRSGVLTALAWLVPHETAAVSAQVLCTPYNHAPCHFMQSHIRKVYACLAVTCHLHFWQNDRDLLRATVVTRGWNGYWNNEWLYPFTLAERCPVNPHIHYMKQFKRRYCRCRPLVVTFVYYEFGTLSCAIKLTKVPHCAETENVHQWSPLVTYAL